MSPSTSHPTFDQMPQMLQEMYGTMAHIESQIQILIRQTTECTAPGWMNIEEAAAYLGIAKQTLYGYVSEKSIPHIKKFSHLRFKKDDLDAWMELGRRVSIEDIRLAIDRANPPLGILRRA